MDRRAIDTRLKSVNHPTDEGAPKWKNNSCPTDVVIWLSARLHLGALRCDTDEVVSLSALADAIRLDYGNATDRQIRDARDAAHSAELKLASKREGDMIAALPIWEKVVKACASARVECERVTRCECGVSVEPKVHKLGVIYFNPSTTDSTRGIQWTLNNQFGWQWAGMTCQDCGEDKKKIWRVLGDQMPPYITVADVPQRFLLGQNSLLEVAFRTRGDGGVGEKKTALYRMKAQVLCHKGNHFIAVLREDRYHWVLYDSMIGPVAIDNRKPDEAGKIEAKFRESRNATFVVFVRVEEAEMEAIGPPRPFGNDHAKSVEVSDKLVLREVVPQVWRTARDKVHDYEKAEKKLYHA